ncbi:hypothetical protein M9Y10_007388 [Tritrichomonas musculus]|uniref:Helicase C-terminal domain-containing protein n=1 Tax=Tritrichomonas musculus TaxID=1915356 RepID=A0ABR2J178_9EUKA
MGSSLSNVDKKNLPKGDFISCPMTPQQNAFCKSILLNNKENLMKHINNRKILKNILKSCCHPFLVKPQIFDSSMNMVNFSGKMIILDKILSNSREKNKIIIISQINEMIDILNDYLIKKKYKFAKLDSYIRGRQRQETIDSFNCTNDDFIMLLLNANAGLKGINFTAATTVVVYDGDFEQINDISFGDAKIHYLFSKRSCEQMMMKLRYEKLNKGIQITEQDNEKILRYGAYWAFNRKEEALQSIVNELVESDISDVISKSSNLMNTNDNSINLNKEDFWFDLFPNYYNPKDSFFSEFSKDKLFVDKTEMINIINEQFFENNKRYLCVSRPQKFGKSCNAKMLCSYYSRGNDNKQVFQCLKVARDSSWVDHINKHNVIYMDISKMVCKMKSQFSESEQINIVQYIQSLVLNEIKNAYPSIDLNVDFLSSALIKIHEYADEKFIIIIDEWDYILSNFSEKQEVINDFSFFMTSMFKGIQTMNYISLAYLTGVLPMKCYNSLYLCNEFIEFSMDTPHPFIKCFGFTEDEVKRLCINDKLDLNTINKWYDGYILRGVHIYNPYSIINSIKIKKCQIYWPNSESIQKLAVLIDLNFDELQDTIVQLLSGVHYSLLSPYYESDITKFVNKDDVLTYLVVMGYLAHNECEVFIPNLETFLAFDRAIRLVKSKSWTNVILALQKSDKLLDDTINGREEQVVEGMDQLQNDDVPILSYKDELSLCCVISIAYFSANKYYTIVHEFPFRKGFADVAFIPCENANRPAVLVELRLNENANGAIKQIESNKYHGSLSEITSGDAIVVCVNFDKKKKDSLLQDQKI